MGAGGGRRSDRIRTSRAKPGQGGKSKGSGGKVQVSTKSQTGRAKVVNDREDDEQEDDEGNGTWTDTRDYFICSDFPVTNTKFMSENLVEGAVETPEEVNSARYLLTSVSGWYMVLGNSR